MTKLTLKAAQDRCKFWQERLRLQDWDVRVTIERMHIIDPDTLGSCGSHGFKRQASIRLLDPRDFAAQGFEDNWDWEVTIVHELLHLHTHDLFPKGWPVNTTEEIAAERMIDALSHALVIGNSSKGRK